jgi:WD40 repeat protein
LVRVLNHNNARVTCIKFSKDYKYFITCDADGVIRHYEKCCHRDTNDHLDVSAALSTTVGSSHDKYKKDSKDKKEHFPFTLIHTIQD